jgi:hypothetical protein
MESIAGKHLAERLRRARLALLRGELIDSVARARLHRAGNASPSRKALAREVDAITFALTKWA